jgi:serine/threonine-protein kinase HipA
MADDDRTLVVLMARRRVGLVAMDNVGRFEFTYDGEWLDFGDATPLSLSLPLAAAQHGDEPVRAFLWGLLPDNERVLERWARTYQVSAGNPFAILRHVGEDCAGAAQFVRPERVDALVVGSGEVRWLSEDEVAHRLRVLRGDPSAWHVNGTGQFSLAGAQAKTALHHDPATRRWGDSSGAIPTTHILKPAVTGLDDHDLNEHLCLGAARALDMPASVSQVLSFNGQRAIVIERYDRRRSATGEIRRVHQEDICQALGRPPSVKYQQEGGPTPEDVLAVLRRTVAPLSLTDDVNRFVDALALNWIIGGTDAHAKNYSVLLLGGQTRLAPLYDIASALPYEDMYLPKLRMAMKIGGEYRLEAIRGRHWRRFAQDNGLDPDEVVARVASLADRAPDAFAGAAGDRAVRALRSRLPSRLVDLVSQRSAVCRQRLAT